MKETFKENRMERELIGRFYRKINQEYGEKVNVQFVDPRNLLFIWIYFFQQIKRNNISFLRMLKNVYFHIKRDAVFINGTYVENHLRYDKIIENYL